MTQRDEGKSRASLGLTRRRLIAAGAGAGAALLGGLAHHARAVGDADLARPRLVGIGGEEVAASAPAAPATVAPVERAAPLAPSAAAQPAGPEAPAFSDVAWAEPWDALLFLAGRHRRYPGATIESMMGFSPADILETMDTVVLDTVQANRGAGAVSSLYYTIAAQALEALLAVYGDTPVLLALDAGHGGKQGVYHDPGSNGTEAWHNRQTVLAIEETAAAPRYAGITIRRLYNDAIGDDFGLPAPEDRKGAAALTLRLVRAAMLAQEVDGWNGAHPDAPVALHMLSVHYNAGSGGILVLHQGGAVPAAYQNLSIGFGRTYVANARAALNRSGLLPYQLAYALGTGLSDDRVLYEPNFRLNAVNPYTGVNRSTFPRRYAMLQASLLQRDYALGALIYHKLV